MSCEDCYYQDEITGACINDQDDCVDGSQFTRKFQPEDIYKTVYMLIYNLGGNIEVPVEELDELNEDDIQIEHDYDPSTKKFILTSEPQPPKPNLIKVPKKLMKPRKKLFIPGRN